jgi:hypothetical protein
MPLLTKVVCDFIYIARLLNIMRPVRIKMHDNAKSRSFTFAANFHSHRSMLSQAFDFFAASYGRRGARVSALETKKRNKEEEEIGKEFIGNVHQQSQFICISAIFESRIRRVVRLR